MKKCGKCREIKDFASFNKDKQTKDGYHNRCRTCVSRHNTSTHTKNLRKIRYDIKKDEINAYHRKYAKSNREKFNKYFKKYADKNRSKVREDNNRFYNSEKQKPKNNAISAKRKAAKLHRTPSWLTKEQLIEIQSFYIEAQRKTQETGILHTVDHIEPLQGVEVSGLHVPWNLQVMVGPGPNGNFSKKNKRL